MGRSDAAYEARQHPGPQDRPAPGRGQANSAADRGLVPRRLIGAGLLTGLALLLGAGLDLFASLVAFFDAPDSWGGSDIVRHFWTSGFGGDYVAALALLGGLMVAAALLAGRGGASPAAFLAGGLLGLLGQVAALHVAMLRGDAAGAGGPLGLALDRWAFCLPLVAVIAVPAGLVGGEWSRSRLARTPREADGAHTPSPAIRE